MSHPQLTGSRTRSVDLSAARTALWLAATVFLALLALYFVGIDQGAISQGEFDALKSKALGNQYFG